MNQFPLADGGRVREVIEEAAEGGRNKNIRARVPEGLREGGSETSHRRRTLFMFIKQLHHSVTILRRAAIHFLGIKVLRLEAFDV